MSNHVHVVARMDPVGAVAWDAGDVAQRWLTLYPSDYHRDGSPKPPTATQVACLASDAGRVATCRRRLADVGWFMKAIKEPLARRANREDACSGTFWQGRFHATPLLDQAALVACMVYVDLNPVRAAMCERPEDGLHTSVRARALLFKQAGNQGTGDRADTGSAPPGPALAPTEACVSGDGHGDVGPALTTYLSLVDATGRILRSDKRGAIPADLAPVLARLGLNARRWVDTMAGPGQMRGTGLGQAAARTTEAIRRNAAWVANCCRLFPTGRPMTIPVA